jgi:hypothetical protein
LAPLTDAIGSGLLPTPTAVEYGTSQNGINGKGGSHERPSAGTPSLSTMARRGLIPTPTAGDATGNSTTPRWPTPTARDYKDTGDLRCVPENGLLPRVVQRVERDRLWPTPRPGTSGTPAGGSEFSTYRRTPSQQTGRHHQHGRYLQAEVIEHEILKGQDPETFGPNGGSLNPTWVDWLMGFPTGWTDLER